MTLRTHQGPWTTRTQGEANHHFILAEDGKWLAALQFNGELMGSKQEANARLIAAAPELLAALQGILDVASVRIDDPRIKQWDAARMAIAKAGGDK